MPLTTSLIPSEILFKRSRVLTVVSQACNFLLNFYRIILSPAAISQEYELNQRKMKKLILILMTAAVFGCGDGNRSSERNDIDDNDNTEQAEPDTTNTDEYGRQDSEMNEQDTTSTYDRNESDTLNNK